MPSPTLLDVLRRDLRSARRTLASRPLLSALAILTVALGVGSTTATATYAVSVLLLVLVAAVATAVPVGRAVRIEPVEALREE